MRLLTEEALCGDCTNITIHGSKRYPCSLKTCERYKSREVVAELQDAKTHKETLKAVGEWLLTGRRVPSMTVKDAFFILPQELEAFKRGEMPEEAANERT